MVAFGSRYIGQVHVALHGLTVPAENQRDSFRKLSVVRSVDTSSVVPVDFSEASWSPVGPYAQPGRLEPRRPWTGVAPAPNLPGCPEADGRGPGNGPPFQTPRGSGRESVGRRRGSTVTFDGEGGQCRGGPGSVPLYGASATVSSLPLFLFLSITSRYGSTHPPAYLVRLNSKRSTCRMCALGRRVTKSRKGLKIPRYPCRGGCSS